MEEFLNLMGMCQSVWESSASSEPIDCPSYTAAVQHIAVASLRSLPLGHWLLGALSESAKHPCSSEQLYHCTDNIGGFASLLFICLNLLLISRTRRLTWRRIFATCYFYLICAHSKSRIVHADSLWLFLTEKLWLYVALVQLEVLLGELLYYTAKLKLWLEPRYLRPALLPDLQDQERCAICLENMTDPRSCRRMRNCVHVFHTQCIVTALLHSCDCCPLCRQ
jgi:hypothetical protein